MNAFYLLNIKAKRVKSERTMEGLNNPVFYTQHYDRKHINACQYFI